MAELYAVACAAPLILALDPTARDQIGDRGVPLAVRDAGSSKDRDLGMPAIIRGQEIEDRRGWRNTVGADRNS